MLVFECISYSWLFLGICGFFLYMHDTQGRECEKVEWRPQTLPEEQESYWPCVSVYIMIQLWAEPWFLFLKMSDSWNTGHCVISHLKSFVEMLSMFFWCWGKIFLRHFYLYAGLTPSSCIVVFRLIQCHTVSSTLVQLCHIALMKFAQMIHKDVPYRTGVSYCMTVDFRGAGPYE